MRWSGFALVVVAATPLAPAKDCRTYFTDDRIAVGRHNAATYEWAKTQRQRILEKGDAIRYYIGPDYTAADDFAALSDEQLWILQPPTSIPRAYEFNAGGVRTICPECGLASSEISPWNMWRIDPVGHPYKVQCRRCSDWFPSNSYHEGDMTSGPYPDGGSGYRQDGRMHYFLREYAHMCYGSVVIPTLRSLSEAYALTGDEKYAHAGCVLLARVASEYPNYGWETVEPARDLENRFDRTYLGPWDNRHPHYDWKQGGMITDLIWETFCLEAIVLAYDAFYDHLADDPALLAFVRGKGLPVESAAGLRGYIEDYVLRAGMVGLLEGWIRGNEGFHQATALTLALVLDDYSDTYPNSKDMVDYAYHGEGRAAYMMVNGLTRDGGGHESPNYNRIKRDFIRVSKLMEMVRARRPGLFPLDAYPDIFAHPKARNFFDYNIDIIVLDTKLPSIGDCGGIREPSRRGENALIHSLLKGENVFAFKRYGEPRYALAATAWDGQRYAGDLWEPYPDEAITAALADDSVKLERTSRFLDGYGVAILESGRGGHKRAAILNYTSLIGHRQNDHLSIQLVARGLDLLPDLGYPRTWDHRWQWDSNSMAHNTVTVDETRPARLSFRNAASLFVSEDGVHAVTAHHNPYPEGMALGDTGSPPVDLYERAVVLVDVDSDRFYAVDVFAVRGGQQHDQSWHAMLVEPEVPALEWQQQGSGTLAGPDAGPFSAYTDRWGRAHEDGDFPCYLTHIRRAPLTAPAAWTWRSGLPEGDTLRLHAVPTGATEAIMGKGRSPAWPDGEYLDYLLLRRETENGAASHFVSVLDAFQEQPVVEDVRLISKHPVALEIVRNDGVDTVTVNIPEEPSRSTAHRALGIAVHSRNAAGETTRLVQAGSLGGEPGPGYAHATLEAVDYGAHAVEFAPFDGWQSAFAPGRAVRIYNSMRSSLHRVAAAKETGNRIRLTLDKTPLVGQFPVTAQDGRRLRLGVSAPFMTGHADEDGALTDGPNDFYHGCYAGEGEQQALVTGIADTEPPFLHLAEEGTGPPPDFAGQTVCLWLYGPGDRVEAARVRIE